MKKRILPAPASPLFNEAVKESIETLTGLRGGRIAPLPATASAADVVAKVNEIIDRLQGR